MTTSTITCTVLTYNPKTNRGYLLLHEVGDVFTYGCDNLKFSNISLNKITPGEDVELTFEYDEGACRAHDAQGGAIQVLADRQEQGTVTFFDPYTKRGFVRDDDDGEILPFRSVVSRPQPGDRVWFRSSLTLHGPIASGVRTVQWVQRHTTHGPLEPAAA